MSVILIPHINVFAANALATPWLVSPMPIFAACMLGHAIADDLGARSLGTAYIHHDASLRAERFEGKNSGQTLRHNVHQHQHRSASLLASDNKDYPGEGRNGLSMSTQPVCLCDLTVSLLIEVAGPSLPPDKVASVLTGRRLAGGRIQNHGKIRTFDTVEGAQCFLPSGFLTLDRTELLASEEPEGGSRVDRLLKLLFEKNTEDKSWLTSTVLGYLPITEFEERPGAQTDPHAFAEPLVGVVELKSLRQAQNEKYDLNNALWRHNWHSDGFGGMPFLLENNA